MMSSLLSVKARLLMRSVEAIEAQIAKEDYEEKETDTFIVWRKISLRSEEIYTIAQYDGERCIIIMYDSSEYFVKESYTNLHKRWQIAKSAEPPKHQQEEAEEEEETDD